MSLNKRMGKENLVNLHDRVLLSCLKNDIMKFADKWMKLEKNHPE